MTSPIRGEEETIYLEEKYMKFLPNFNTMVEFYPAAEHADEVKERIGGDVNQEHLHNTCVIRVSEALNYAGHKIPHDSEIFRTKRGADKLWYGLRVKEFWNYMIRTFGKPDVHEKVDRYGIKIPIDNFVGKRGIIAFRVDTWSDATGHFTLWDGKNLLYGGESYNYWFGATEAALWEELKVRKLVNISYEK